MLVVKAWREDGSFRATVSWSEDVSSPEPSEHRAAAGPAEVLAMVDRWLQAIVVTPGCG
jgi:hypothetical protein